MIHFEHEAVTLRDAFKITQDEETVFEEIMSNLKMTERNLPVSWVIQRLWIDERLSENARVYAIFTVGRFYEYWHFLRGLPGNEN